MKKFVILCLGISLFISSSRAESESKGRLRIELQNAGKTIATLFCQGSTSIVQPCRVDAASSTVFISIPSSGLSCESKGAVYDDKTRITQFPDGVHVFIESAQGKGMDVLTAEKATLQEPPTP